MLVYVVTVVVLCSKDEHTIRSVLHFNLFANATYDHCQVRNVFKLQVIPEHHLTSGMLHRLSQDGSDGNTFSERTPLLTGSLVNNFGLKLMVAFE